MILIFGYLLSGQMDYTIIMINVLFFYSNLVLLNINKMQKNRTHEFALILFVLMELTFNIKCNFAVNENLRIEDQSRLNNQRFELYSRMDQIGDNTYRVAGRHIYYDDEFLPMKKGSITLFLSSNNRNMFSFLNNSGYYATSSHTLFNPDNHFMNSLLGVKYWYGPNNDHMLYQKISTQGINGYEVEVYENLYALTLGYLINENKKIDYHNNPFDYQNEIVKAISGESIFKPLHVTKEENNTYEVTTSDTDTIYLYVDSESKIDFYNIYTNIYVNGIYLDSKNVMENIVEIKNEYPNQTVQIKLEYLAQLDYEPNVYFYGENLMYNLELLKRLQQRQLHDVEIKKNKLRGIIDAEEPSILMMTVPYEKGFTILVDGKKTMYEKIYDAFIGISIPKGKHIVEIQYNKPYGFTSGIIISISTLIILCTIFLKKSLCMKN